MRSFTMMNVAKPFVLACNEPSTFFPKFLTPHSHPKIAAAATLNNRNRVLPLRCKSFSLSSNVEVPKEIENEEEFIVVNFYRFVFIEDPEAEVTKHLFFMEGRDIHGRIYINKQGINAQLEGGISHLPLLDPSMRAAPLAPSEWRKRLEAVNNCNNSSHENFNPSCILLDVRNGYEWDVGHFQGAQRPDVDCFRATSFGQSESEVIALDPLAAVDKERTDILMYCTGGIRCDVYSAILRKQGFKRLYTLKGGVSHYLESEGSVGWVGNLFVFDARLSLQPSTYKPAVEIEASTMLEGSLDNSFAKCYICGSQVSELRHCNCANLDCNLLFLCCSGCVKHLRGCCCIQCTSANRLRPVLTGHQRYQKWHNYRDIELQKLVTS